MTSNETDPTMFSPATLNLFAQLLTQLRLDPMDPHLVEQTAQVVVARDELTEALKAAARVVPTS